MCTCHKVYVHNNPQTGSTHSEIHRIHRPTHTGQHPPWHQRSSGGHHRIPYSGARIACSSPVHSGRPNSTMVLTERQLLKALTEGRDPHAAESAVPLVEEEAESKGAKTKRGRKGAAPKPVTNDYHAGNDADSDMDTETRAPDVTKKRRGKAAAATTAKKLITCEIKTIPSTRGSFGTSCPDLKNRIGIKSRKV